MYSREGFLKLTNIKNYHFILFNYILIWSWSNLITTWKFVIQGPKLRFFFEIFFNNQTHFWDFQHKVHCTLSPAALDPSRPLFPSSRSSSLFCLPNFLPPSSQVSTGTESPQSYPSITPSLVFCLPGETDCLNRAHSIGALGGSYTYFWFFFSGGKLLSLPCPQWP